MYDFSEISYTNFEPRFVGLHKKWSSFYEICFQLRDYGITKIVSDAWIVHGFWTVWPTTTVPMEVFTAKMTTRKNLDLKSDLRMWVGSNFSPFSWSISDPFFVLDHKIIDTSVIKSEDPKKNCPRCGGAVFSAEAITCAGRFYHKKCASCAACEKKLTYNTIFNGKSWLTIVH